MKLVLTDMSDKEIIVDSDSVKLIEPFADGSTHIIFGADLGRTVKESMASIAACLGVSAPVATAHASAMGVAKAIKAKKKK